MQVLPKLMCMNLVEISIITASTLPEGVVIWGLNVDTCMLYPLIKMKRGQLISHVVVLQQSGIIVPRKKMQILKYCGVEVSALHFAVNLSESILHMMSLAENVIVFTKMTWEGWVHLTKNAGLCTLEAWLIESNWKNCCGLNLESGVKLR